MATMVQFAEIAPDDLNNGKVWIKPSISQAYMYLESAWRPFAGGDFTHTYTVPLTVFIRGINRTTMVETTSIRKADKIHLRADTLMFRLHDIGDEINPREGQEVLVFKKDNAGSTPEIWFGGNIDSAVPKEIAPGQRNFIYTIQCSSYEKRANKEYPVESYDDDSAYTIILDLLDNYGEEFYIAVLTGTPTVDAIRFNYKPLGECINDIAEMFDWRWYIDYNKKVLFFKPKTTYAPYQLTLIN